MPRTPIKVKQAPATPHQRDVPLAALASGEDTQARVHLDPEVVADYAEAMLEGATFPPVVLFHDGACYWIGDGFHRIEAARQVEQTTIPAEVSPGGLREALLYACGANRTHGLPRTNADKRRVVEVLLEDAEWATWSDNHIARHCGVAVSFVGRIRSALFPEHSGEDQPRTYERHGQVLTMHTSRIGTHQAAPAPTNGQPVTARQVRETVRDVFGEGVGVPQPPAERPYAMEESLGELYGRVAVYREAVKRQGGLAVLMQTWTQDRKQEFRRKVEEITATWTVLAAEVEAAAPEVPLALVPRKDAPRESQP
jgi:hypothetical protein